MSFQKRGQTATEYMIILAVVIVIALVVVVAMGKFPGIGKSVGARSSAAFWSSQDIAVTSYSVDSAGAVTVNIRNNMRNAIKMKTFEVDGVNLTGSAGTLTAGGAKSLSGTDASLACQAGQGFSYPVNVVYEDAATGAEYTFTGDGNNLEGTCAN